MLSAVSAASGAAELEINQSAPLFKTKTHNNQDFDLAKRRDSGEWTVLFFYPKAETPGCTKQACAFRDKIDVIEGEGAKVFGISADSVSKQAAFHEKHQMKKLTLLADPDSKIIKLYGTKMPLLPMSKRWTFLIDPQLIIRKIEKNVDPAKDADQVAAWIKELKATKL